MKASDEISTDCRSKAHFREDPSRKTTKRKERRKGKERKGVKYLLEDFDTFFEAILVKSEKTRKKKPQHKRFTRMWSILCRTSWERKITLNPSHQTPGYHVDLHRVWYTSTPAEETKKEKESFSATMNLPKTSFPMRSESSEVLKNRDVSSCQRLYEWQVRSPSSIITTLFKQINKERGEKVDSSVPSPSSHL